MKIDLGKVRDAVEDWETEAVIKNIDIMVDVCKLLLDKKLVEPMSVDDLEKAISDELLHKDTLSDLVNESVDKKYLMKILTKDIAEKLVGKVSAKQNTAMREEDYIKIPISKIKQYDKRLLPEDCDILTVNGLMIIMSDTIAQNLGFGKIGKPAGKEE